MRPTRVPLAFHDQVQHADRGDPAEALAFFKDLGLTSALLLLIVNGAGSLSLDDRPSKKRR